MLAITILGEIFVEISHHILSFFVCLLFVRTLFLNVLIRGGSIVLSQGQGNAALGQSGNQLPF